MDSQNLKQEMLDGQKSLKFIFCLLKYTADWCNQKAAKALSKLFIEWKEACLAADPNDLNPFLQQSKHLLEKCDFFCSQLVRQSNVCKTKLESKLSLALLQLKDDKDSLDSLKLLQQMYEEKVHARFIRFFDEACALESRIQDMRTVSIMSEMTRKEYENANKRD